MYSRLLYCCGLRPQEPPAIRTEDVNLITGDVYIRQSKRHKDRHIIMSEDMRALCQKYDSVAGKRQWFFQKWDGTPYETSWYNQVWRNLISKSGISWKGAPRPYDLRHAFASRNIIRWINNGKDVMEYCRTFRHIWGIQNSHQRFIISTFFQRICASPKL